MVPCANKALMPTGGKYASSEMSRVGSDEWEVSSCNYDGVHDL